MYKYMFLYFDALQQNLLRLTISSVIKWNKVPTIRKFLSLMTGWKEDKHTTEWQGLSAWFKMDGWVSKSFNEDLRQTDGVFVFLIT